MPSGTVEHLVYVAAQSRSGRVIVRNRLLFANTSGWRDQLYQLSCEGVVQLGKADGLVGRDGASPWRRGRRRLARCRETGS